VQDLVNDLLSAASERFDVALVSVGVNDVTGRTSAGDWRARLARMIELLQARYGVQFILLTSLPPMHLFPALPQPLRWYLGARAKQLDRLLGSVATGHSQCERLRLALPLSGPAIAADGFHPGAAAYAAWAHQAAAAIRTRLRRGDWPFEH
jgi:lysophospholipase L1-like esterase